MWRLVVLFAVFTTLIIINYKKEKNGTKTLLASLYLVLLFGIGYSGAILTRPLPPLFFGHIVALIAGLIGFAIYLLKGRALWYLLILPPLPLIATLILNYFDGSRYEAMKSFITSIKVYCT